MCNVSHCPSQGPCCINLSVVVTFKMLSIAYFSSNHSFISEVPSLYILDPTTGELVVCFQRFMRFELLCRDIASLQHKV